MINLTFVIAGNTPDAPPSDIYKSAAKRFALSYKKFPPGYEHKLVLIDSNAGLTDKIASYFEDIEHSVIEYRASGWDIGAHQFASFNMPADDWIMCFSSWAYFRQEGWLRAFVEARSTFGDGLYGSTSSFQNYPHIRGTGFFVRCERMHRYPFGCNSREESFQFESGKNSLSQWCIKQGYCAWLVSPEKAVPLAESRKLNNVFRRGDQSNIWTFDKHTDAFDGAPEKTRKKLARLADIDKYRYASSISRKYSNFENSILGKEH